MNALDQAAQFQQQAIDVLLAERQRIDDRLAQLGQGVGKKRGRKPKNQEQEKAPHTEGRDAAALPLR